MGLKERSLSIFIAEADPERADAAQKRLASVKGWAMRFLAAPGKESAAAVRGSLFDLAIVNAQLPDGESLRLLELIRRLNPKAAVIMVSDSASEKTAVEAMRRGAADYLSRQDFEQSDPEQILRRALEIQELQNENLELRQVNRMKDEFISSVSHELRTPLAVILGYAKSLEDGDLGPVADVQKKALEAVRRRGERMLQMVNRLLTFKEASNETQEALLRPTDLKMLLEAWLDERWPTKKTRGIEISREFPPEPVWILSDPNQLKDAVDNIISNAVKFSGNGSPVSIRLTIRPGPEAWIQVIDQGRGISPEYLPRLFDGFFHTDSELTREITGLGLGLALSRQIISLHGGRIWIESQGPGTGATATISLPLSLPDSPHVMIEQKRRTEKRRVLICEDNSDIVEIVRLFVAGFSDNLELTTSYTGREAIDLIGTRRFDLIIQDMMLPDMSGLDVIERIGRLPADKKPPVLVLSGHEGAAKQAVRQGAQDFLMKPFSKREFLDKVLSLIGLERRTDRRTPDSASGAPPAS